MFWFESERSSLVEKRFKRAYVVTEVHLERDCEKRVFTPNRAVEYSQLTRYLSVAGEVRVIGRVRNVREPSSRIRVDGPHVVIEAFPEYRGLKELIKRVPRLLHFLYGLEWNSSVAIGRLPEVLSLMVWATSMIKKVPFFAFVVADAHVLGESLAQSLNLPLVRSVLPRITSRAIKTSAATVYVTREFLQSKFPPPDGRPTISRSNVMLTSDSFAERQGPLSNAHDSVVVFVGTMGSLLKGQDVLIQMMTKLSSVHDGAVKLVLVGDGPTLPYLKELAVQKGVEESVHFVGNVSDAKVLHDLLDAADVFVSASRTEGLPRATIEAMARSLPVVSTRAGGVAELIDADWIVDIDDVGELASQCARLLKDPDLRLQVGERNRRVALEIARDTDESRLVSFLQRAFQ